MESYNEEDRELKRDAQRADDETKDALDEAGDKIKVGAKAKAVGNKIKDPDKDLDT